MVATPLFFFPQGDSCQSNTGSFVTGQNRQENDFHWLFRTVDYRQIENSQRANQIHRFTIDYGKFILKLDRNTELARAVDVMMARTKRIYILMIELNKLFFFFFLVVFSKRNRKQCSPCSYRVIETLVKVWENSKKLWKHSPAARVPTAFLVLPNFLLRTSWSRFGFLRRGVKTAFLRAEGRRPDTSDKFTIPQIDGKSRSKCSLSNVAGKGSRQHDFCTTERAIFDNSRFEVGEKLLSSQLVVEISSEEKKSGISERGAIYILLDVLVCSIAVYYIKVSGIASSNKFIKTIRYPHM